MSFWIKKKKRLPQKKKKRLIDVLKVLSKKHYTLQYKTLPTHICSYRYQYLLELIQT